MQVFNVDHGPDGYCQMGNLSICIKSRWTGWTSSSTKQRDLETRPVIRRSLSPKRFGDILQMKLNALEFALMNNPVRAASQQRIESSVLIGAPRVLAGKHVLEVGCGRGVGLEILLRLGATHVTGFDLDPQMVVLAEKRVAKYGERAHVFVGDAATIAAPDASFDAVVDYGIIHHIPPWPQALREIARVLAPGGVFYFEDLLRGFISSWPVRALFDHPQATQFTAAEFRNELERAGLSVYHWREVRSWGVIGRASKNGLLASSVFAQV
jgi:SAM-dependent methyltransferase